MSLEGLNADFKDLLTTLVRGNVEFLIVGAYALAAHGFPRSTGDIDILVRPTTDNAVRVFRRFLRSRPAGSCGDGS